eukprot:1124102-Rhodomonas_salina.4
MSLITGHNIQREQRPSAAPKIKLRKAGMRSPTRAMCRVQHGCLGLDTCVAPPVLQVRQRSHQGSERSVCGAGLRVLRLRLELGSFSSYLLAEGGCKRRIKKSVAIQHRATKCSVLSEQPLSVAV